jgi:hypothetical protein
MDHLPIAWFKHVQGHDGAWEGDNIGDGKKSNFHETIQLDLVCELPGRGRSGNGGLHDNFRFY